MSDWKALMPRSKATATLNAVNNILAKNLFIRPVPVGYEGIKATEAGHKYKLCKTPTAEVMGEAKFEHLARYQQFCKAVKRPVVPMDRGALADTRVPTEDHPEVRGDGASLAESVSCSLRSTPQRANSILTNATGKQVRGGVPTDQSSKKQMTDAAKLSAEEDPTAQAIQAVHHHYAPVHYAPVTINNNNHFILPSGALGSLLTLCVYDYSISEFVTE